MTDHDARDALAERIRVLLESYHVEQKRMFGTVAFMIDGHLAVTAGRGGVLLVRVDPDDHESHLARGAVPASMGTDRPMGRAWLEVPAGRLVDDAELAQWVGVGVTTAATKGGA